jgi:hypothetical protein
MVRGRLMEHLFYSSEKFKRKRLSPKAKIIQNMVKIITHL